MKPMLRIACTALLLSLPAHAAQSGKSSGKPFRPADYPPTRFRVTEAEHTLGDLKIRIIQAREKSGATFVCRGWIELRPAGGAPRWIERGDLEPVGSSFGLFVPHWQPSRELFLIAELKNYDGNLLLIDKKGSLRQVPGGAYFVDLPHRLLFSLSYSDVAPSLAVIELDTGKTVFQGIDVEIVHWYRLGSGLFFIHANKSGPVRETGHFFDFAKKTFQLRKVTPEMWSKAEPVDYDFMSGWYQDCTSEPRWIDLN
jgi:hypothetical protein